MHSIRVLNDHGDTPLAQWDDTDEISIEKARKVFDEMVAEGYLTFRADEGTKNTGERIKRFDPSAMLIYVFKKSAFAGG